MPVTNTWDNAEHTILRQTFSNPWTWEECYKVMREAAGMMNLMSHEVHMIEDLRKGSKLPVGSSVISTAKAILDQLPDNWGVTVVVSDSAFIKVMVSTFTKVFSGGMGRKLFFTTSMDEAYLIIEKHSTPVDRR